MVILISRRQGGTQISIFGYPLISSRRRQQTLEVVRMYPQSHFRDKWPEYKLQGGEVWGLGVMMLLAMMSFCGVPHLLWCQSPRALVRERKRKRKRLEIEDSISIFPSMFFFLREGVWGRPVTCRRDTRSNSRF